MELIKSFFKNSKDVLLTYSQFKISGNLAILQVFFTNLPSDSGKKYIQKIDLGVNGTFVSAARIRNLKGEDANLKLKCFSYNSGDYSFHSELRNFDIRRDGSSLFITTNSGGGIFGFLLYAGNIEIAYLLTTPRILNRYSFRYFELQISTLLAPLENSRKYYICFDNRKIYIREKSRMRGGLQIINPYFIFSLENIDVSTLVFPYEMFNFSFTNLPIDFIDQMLSVLMNWKSLNLQTTEFVLSNLYFHQIYPTKSIYPYMEIPDRLIDLQEI